MTHEFKIYVADLAAYNAGHLHGVWIDVSMAPRKCTSAASGVYQRRLLIEAV